MNIKELFNYYCDNEMKCPYCATKLVYGYDRYYSCSCINSFGINETKLQPFFIGKNTFKSFALMIYYNNNFYYFEEYEDGLLEIRVAEHKAYYNTIFSGYSNINFENKFPYFDIEKINTIKLFQ